MNERALATIETVAGISPIDGADAIEAVQVRGWTVVAKRGEFSVGDRCVYVEIDSFLPVDHDAYAFLAPRGTKMFNGVEGHVLKTAKLRGTISQGLLLTPSLFEGLEDVEVGADVTAACQISKWEPPIPADISGQVAGPFPTKYAAKTDSERIQNLSGDAWQELLTGDWVATEKVDGTSLTVICDETGTIRVCGRNWELVESDNTMWRLARAHVIPHLEAGMFVQAEVYGEGIQSNPLKIRGQAIAVFAVGRDRATLGRDDWPDWAAACAAPQLNWELPQTVAEAVEQADGMKSAISPERNAEGVVWHERNGRCFNVLDGRSNFKVISNRYLLKHDR